MGHDARDESIPPPDLDGAGLHIAVVCSGFNSRVTTRLLDGVRRGLHVCGVTDAEKVWVPGSFEIPLTAKTVALTGRYNIG